MRQTAVLLLLALAAVSMVPSPAYAQGNSLGGVTVDEVGGICILTLFPQKQMTLSFLDQVRSVYSGFGPYLSGICAVKKYFFFVLSLYPIIPPSFLSLFLPSTALPASGMPMP